MNGKIIRVNMSDLAISVEEPSGEYRVLGGRGLVSTIVAREVPPRCHPLSAQAKIVFAPGILAGTSVPSSGCLWAGCKSPMTGGIKNAAVGGTAGTAMGRLGIRALVLKGCVRGDQTYILHVTKNGAVLIPNGPFRGIGNHAFVKQMADRFGDTVSVVSIGPAGEMKLSSATIAVTDMEMRPVWHARKCGVGSVMGSKGLKGIIIDDTGTASVEPAAREEFKRGQIALAEALAERLATYCTLSNLGTAQAVKTTIAKGSYPAPTHRLGRLEDGQTIPSESGNQIPTRGRGWKAGHPCMPGCTIKCAIVYLDEIGQHLSSGLDHETITTYGAGCGIFDLDALARQDRLCDDYGLDIVEAGAAIAVVMEAGLERYGDAQAVIGLAQEIGDGTPLGRILGHGAEFTGKAFGIIRVDPKEQGMSENDHGACKPNEVTLSTQPQAGHHPAWRPVEGKVADNLASLYRQTGQAELNMDAEVITALLDCTGLCPYVRSLVADIPDSFEAILTMCNSRVGADLAVDSFLEIGNEVVELEREFDIRSGLGPSDEPVSQ